MDCDYPAEPLVKIASSRLREMWPDALAMVQAFELESTVTEDLLLVMQETGVSARQAACQWLEGNPNAWKQAVEAALVVQASDSEPVADNHWYIYLVIGILVCCLLCVSILVMMLAVKWKSKPALHDPDADLVPQYATTKDWPFIVSSHVLGVGSCGRVYLAHHKQTGAKFAVCMLPRPLYTCCPTC